MTTYFEEINNFLKDIMETEKSRMKAVAELVANHIKKDKIFYVYGPGGHSNLASQERFGQVV